MKILQSIYDLTAMSGGPSTCVCDMMQGLYDINKGSSCGDEVNLLTVRPADINTKNLGAGSEWLKEVVYDYKTPLRLSRNFRKALADSDYDLYHANTLWTDAIHSTCVHARKVGKPYVLSPHGMLYPTALAVSHWKKAVMLKLWFDEDISKATCLHATCRKEAEHCRTYGYEGPIAVIPNAVVFPEGVEAKKLQYTDERGRRQIGFLGRLHPIKKVENVLYAIANLDKKQRERLSFQVMGKHDQTYESWLKEEVHRLGIDDSVEFVGFVSGREKYERLSRLAALLVPSVQENFGMIVPEALICGTPVYASLGTPWEELNEYDAGWRKDNDPQVIAGVLREVLTLSDEELLRKGLNGRKLMEEEYEQHHVASMMMRLYKWILKDGEKPEFVML